MPDPRFFEIGSKIGLDQVAALSFSKLFNAEKKGSGFVEACAPLSFTTDPVKGAGKAAFFSDRRYLGKLQKTGAEYVFVTQEFAEQLPETSIPLISPAPQAAWSRLAGKLYTPRRHEGAAAVHPSARLEEGVTVGVGAVIGQGAEIGAGTRIEAYAVIGPGVRIGRNCLIGAHSTLYCTLLGDRVQLSSGVRIGESGFGVSGDAQGLVDVPQLGRVILQDDVSIGANTCVDRGAFDDTVIGESTKIDNMVQIAHNVRIGRNVIVAAHAGLSGSVNVGDGAMFGGRAGIVDHIDIGKGAKIGAGCVVFKDVEDGQMVSGYPARPSRRFLREMVWLEKSAAAASKDKG
ncbi:MAG TPA: UDP-3-O-(3-hydroxymyristoyl)glucosamine N-acyltransferase [Asticcacaulis sp.]|nr:UDP-3-O-(3-hydroxymyristoyl)glucosamine N-acyltransferase [Asticcacaulis sp.]